MNTEDLQATTQDLCLQVYTTASTTNSPSDELTIASTFETQENSTNTLIITLSVIIAVQMGILVVLAVTVCATCYFCHKKTKPLATSGLDEPSAEPVYEEALPLSSAKDAFAMTLSSAYGVSMQTS